MVRAIAVGGCVGCGGFPLELGPVFARSLDSGSLIPDAGLAM